MNPPATNELQIDPIMERLEDQIGWYDRKSSQNQKNFKRMKTAVILSAAIIPLVIVIRSIWAPLIAAGLGVLIVVLELLQQINEYHENWKTYRSTCEGLKREKYLYMANAGPYASVADPRLLLAERLESLVYQEHVKWASVREQQPKAKSR